jgi:hypothetical protein
MSISDLFFLVMVLGTVFGVAWMAIALLRGRFAAAGRWALGCGAVWLVYLGAGFAVALGTPQRVLGPGQERCFDDMCFGVARVERVAAINKDGRQVRAAGVFYAVTVTTTNRGRGRTQKENGAEASLMDAAGERYLPVVGLGGNGKLDATVAAGQSVESRLVFDVPASAQRLGLVVDHSYALNPGWIIVGDQEHLGHKPTIIRIAD